MKRSLALCLGLSCALGACSGRERRYTRRLMGTLAQVTVYGAGEARSRAAADAVFKEWERIQKTYSAREPDSLVSRLGREAPRGWVTLDEEAYSLLEKSLAWHAMLEGRFDVTFPPLWELWARAAETGEEPTPEEIAQALSRMGSGAIRLDPERRSVRFLKPLRIDLGGVCKDYALLRGAGVLRTELPGGTALLDLGGDLVAYGRKPGGWRIGVRHPLRKGGLLGRLSFQGGAVLTSGCYERFVTVGGKDRCHILDAKSGRPLEGFSSLSVVLPSIEAAHHPSVVYALMGRERGLEAVRSMPGALAVWADLDGKVGTASAWDSRARWAAEP
ncbi:MAG: FAD:protein FMN transferase [Elusimicrobiota bacterium]